MANIKSRKVVIVGAGAVGSGFAFALAQSGAAEEIVLVDVNTDLAKGQALDLAHGTPFYPNVAIHAGEVAPRPTARRPSS
jgi:L-lactate dehydrogenase